LKTLSFTTLASRKKWERYYETFTQCSKHHHLQLKQDAESYEKKQANFNCNILLEWYPQMSEEMAREIMLVLRRKHDDGRAGRFRVWSKYTDVKEIRSEVEAIVNQ